MAKNEPLQPDPLRALDEPSMGRRIWALYLQKGYTRTTFAQAIRCAYSLVYHWERETHEPRLQQLVKIAPVLNTSLDDIVFGRAGRPAAEERLPADQVIMDALNRVHASTAARAAFGKHVESPAGKYQLVTVDYVQRYAAAFDAAIAEGQTPSAAARQAFAEAVNRFALVRAALRQTTPSSSVATHAPPASVPAAQPRSPARSRRARAKRVPRVPQDDGTR